MKVLRPGPGRRRLETATRTAIEWIRNFGTRRIVAIQRRKRRGSEQRDVAILRSCPGLGRINIATLLAEACEPLRRRDYHVLRLLSGVAPVTRRSGKSCIVVRRHACDTRLQNAVYH